MISIARTILKSFIPAITASLLFGSVGHAQMSDLSRLEDEIRRNAELIQQAEMLVKNTNSIKARASLQAAIFLHKESVHLLEANHQLRAAQAVKKAREAILRAIALAKREAKTEENARNAIQRATQRLERAKMLLEESPGRETLPARKLIEEAEAQLSRSMDNMREHLFGAALNLAISSERLSARAIAMLKRGSGEVSEVEKELRKTDRLLDRIDRYEDLSSHPAAERQYREAREIQARAYSQLQAGHTKTALETTRRARSVATNVIRMLTSRPEPENVEQALRLSDGLLEQAEEMAKNEQSEKLAKQLAKAHEIQEQARLHFSENKFGQALRFTLRARELVKQAIGSIERQLNAGEVEATLKDTDALIERLKSTMDQTEDALDHELFERVIAHQEAAWMEFRQERLRAALARTKLARNLARRILDRIGKGHI